MAKQNAFRLVIGSNFTVKPIHQVMDYWCKQLGSAYEILYLPYQQVIQNLIGPESLFTNNADGVNLIFLRLEDCFSGPEFSEENIKSLQAFLADLEKSLAVYSRLATAPLVIVECPSSSASKADEGALAILQHYRHRLSHIANKFSNIFYIPEDEIFDLYPMAIYEDEFSYKEGKIPYTKECFTAVGTVAYRKISAIVRNPYKVVVLDCDNTLWKGVCAEDGAENLILDSNHRLLQKKMVELRDQGFLLCLCSKNIEEDVWSVFKHYEADMPLQKAHITAYRINWLYKSENIKSLSQELGLGLDSFIFLDDNPAEIAEVKAGCPQVACFQLPTRSTQIPIFLKHLWLLDKPYVNDTDRQRALFYQQDKNRKTMEEEAFSFEDFIKKLDLQLSFSPLLEVHLDRIAQMTARTNQFNFTGKRLSVPVLRQSYLASARNCLVVEAKDRYGDYGVIACVFYAIESTTMSLDNFLMSCRALGKRIEHRVWEYLLELAKENGVAAINIPFVRGERNQASVDFLAGVGMPDTAIGNEILYTYLLT